MPISHHYSGRRWILGSHFGLPSVEHNITTYTAVWLILLLNGSDPAGGKIGTLAASGVPRVYGIGFSLFSVVCFRNILLPPYSPLQPLYHPSSLAKSLPIQRPVLTDREDSNVRA